jgi:hypothetical protein
MGNKVKALEGFLALFKAFDGQRYYFKAFDGLFVIGNK